MALLGIGNGAQVALAYAGRHPDKVARLILDSPIPPAINAEGAEEDQVKGEQAALEAFVAQCAATNCPLAPDPKSAVDTIIAAARSGRGPGGASAAAVTSAISTALAFPRGDQAAATNSLAAALAAARSGDDNQLNNLINQGAVAARDRRTVRQPVQRLAEPSDTRPGPRAPRRMGQAVPAVRRGRSARPRQVPELAQRHCAADPKNLKVNVLLMVGQNDPIVGSEGVAAVSATGAQRRSGQQAGDVARHRPRREHLLLVRGAADGRLPGQREPSVHRHGLPSLIWRLPSGTVRSWRSRLRT